MATLDVLIKDKTLRLLITPLITWNLAINSGVRTFVWRWIPVFIGT